MKGLLVPETSDHPHPTLPLKGEGFRKDFTSFFLPLPLEGEAGWGWSAVTGERLVLEPLGAVARGGEGFGDLDQDAVGVGQYVVVPKADHGVTVGFDDAGAIGVSCAFSVLAPVKLDDELHTAAGQIDHVAADPELARELHAELSAPQPRPQADFRLGRFAAQLSGDGGDAFSSQPRFTPTQPSPSRERAFLAQAS